MCGKLCNFLYKHAHPFEVIESESSVSVRLDKAWFQTERSEVARYARLLRRVERGNLLTRIANYTGLAPPLMNKRIIVVLNLLLNRKETFIIGWHIYCARFRLEYFNYKLGEKRRRKTLKIVTWELKSPDLIDIDADNPLRICRKIKGEARELKVARVIKRLKRKLNDSKYFENKLEFKLYKPWAVHEILTA